VVGVDVLAGNVGNEALIAMEFGIEDYAAFASMRGSALYAKAQEDAEFEGHVEPRQRRIAVTLGARNVVNPIIALGNYGTKLLEPVLPSVIGLPRAASAKA
jgi:hypothetical protein